MARIRSPGSESGDRRGVLRWVVGFGAILILIGIGFVLGVGLGILSVGPELIVDHGRGKTEAVPWSVDAPDSIEGLTQPNAIAQELTQGAPEPAAVVEAQPPASSPQSRRGFAIQVGAFSDPGKAEALVRKLRGEGLSVYRVPSVDRGDDRWRVRVGPVQSRAEAEALEQRLKSELNLPTWILSEGDVRDD